MARVDLEDLGFDEGGHLLVKRALRSLPVGAALSVHGTAPDRALHVRAWSRTQGHEFDLLDDTPVVRRGSAEDGRWRGAESTGDATSPVDSPSARWGLAGRSATVEAGAPEFSFRLATRHELWADEAARLYAQAAAAQWDPATAIPWDAHFDLPEAVEDAIVQVMTYLIENETAALVVPARFASQVHPHFREVMQLLAIQAADEARHIEVFTRRALLKRQELGLSTTGGQASLKTLVDETDFALSAMLLSVMGEGSFLSLLHFLRDYAPDPVTEAVTRLAAQDEARHVAFGLAHLAAHIERDPTLLGRLATAIRLRHDSLASTAGLNEEVFDALVVIAAGSWDTAAVRSGWQRVQTLVADMDEGRIRRLARLGFPQEEAQELSSLHTRNFM